jgi:hypothetical protein
VKEASLKGHIVYNPVYMKYLDQANLETENSSVIARGWEGVGVTVKGVGFLWGDENILKL